MLLTDEQVSDFQRIYKDRFGKTINRKDAYEQGAKLVNLMKLIYKPIQQNKKIK
jgi:hypothetical protein